MAALVVTAPLVAWLAGCQPDGQPRLSLEEARQVTASFAGQPFIPPPKTIIDLERLLESQPPADPKAAARDHARVSRKPPAKAGEAELAKFYYRRAEAFERLGNLKANSADLREAYARAGALDDRTRASLGRDMAQAEFRVGRYAAGLRLLHELKDASRGRGARLTDLGLLSRRYAEAGDLGRAGDHLAEMEALVAEARLGRSWDSQGDLLSRDFHTAKGRFLRAQGDLAEAERHFRRALELAAAVREKKPTHRRDSQYGVRVNALASVLRHRGRLVEAEILVRDALRDSLARQGRYSERTASHLRSLSLILGYQGRYADAERIARFVLDIYEKVGLDPSAMRILRARASLASALAGRGRWADAVEQFDGIERALRGQPGNLRKSILSTPAHAFALTRIGRHVDAARVARELLDRQLETVGERFITTAYARGALAMALAAAGDTASALDHFGKAVPILLQRSRRADDATSSGTNHDAWTRLILGAYIDLLVRIRGTGLESRLDEGVAALTFRLAQGASARSVQGALAASAARAAARDATLADLVRKEQDAVTRIGALNGLFANAMNASADQRDGVAIKTLRARIDRLRGARAALAEEIERRFPDYAALMNPKPASIETVRAVMRNGEALIATFVGAERTYVWAVPKRGAIAFATAPMGADRMAAAVRDLRRALDPKAATLGDIPAFDTGLAHEIYEALLKPVENGWKGAAHLLVVAHGPLGQLPFSVLVTRPVRLAEETTPLFARYRDVPWLVRSHTVTVLPSVSSLATLRRLPSPTAGRLAFAGFGDPWFSADRAAAAPAGRAPTTALTGRGLIAIRGVPVRLRAAPALGDLASAGLAKLPRLPDTADEVKGIALAMNADPVRDVFTGKDANEDRVKTMALSGRKVVAFATHGLVPGDLDGLTQPALALSSPEVAGGRNDGLLTMGEILGLRLDADWVVLSACNTASGNGAGAEAISGLGRAFFYAGTRALLVSNWPVETTSARALTTDLFRGQARNATLGRADALRQSMLEQIDRGGLTDGRGRMVFSYAHPIFWAPFSLVGDGGGGKPAS